MDSSRLAALAIGICWVLYYGYFGPVPPGHGEAGVEGVRAVDGDVRFEQATALVKRALPGKITAIVGSRLDLWGGRDAVV